MAVSRKAKFGICHGNDGWGGVAVWFSPYAGQRHDPDHDGKRIRRERQTPHTDFHINQNAHDLDEAFEITVTNQKAEPVRVTIVEHMNRGDNWEITEKSSDYTRTDSHTLEFPLEVPAKGTGKLAYSVRYTW